jgi:hypothetical protein
VLSWGTWYLLDPKKILAIVHMLTPKTLSIHVFNDMAQYYWHFIKDFSYGSHYQATTKDKNFRVDSKMTTSLGKIKQHYMDALILISPHWDIKCHVHTNASILAIGAMLV